MSLNNIYAQINKLSQELVVARQKGDKDLIEELICSIEELEYEADQLTESMDRHDHYWD